MKREPIFTIEDNGFGWQEIVLAATAWGEWQAFFEQTRQRLACLRRATQTGQLPHTAEIRQAAMAFRYAHNLISAEDTRGWLARWQITVDEWMNYLRGQWLWDQAAGRLVEIVAANPVSDAEVIEVINHHAVCADRLRDWAIKLAGRAALVADAGGFDISGPRTTGSPQSLMAHIESEFARQRQLSVTPKLMENKIADCQLDWIRFDCRYVWFPEKRLAREAAWCVSEDGLSLDEVAAAAHREVRQWDFYLDEIESPARPHFLAARAGDWLGPINLMDGFPLFAIVAKTLPAAADPQVRERAERAIIAGRLERAITERVKWEWAG